MYFLAADWLILEALTHALAPSSNDARTLLIKVDLVFLSEKGKSQMLEVKSLYHISILKTKSSQCHYVVMVMTS